MLRSNILRALLAALAAGALVGAPPAAAQGPEIDVVSAPGGPRDGIEATERATGAMTISWRGDPARGCAAAGLCDVSGTVTYTASARESTSTSSSRGPSDLAYSLSLEVMTPVARVLRGPPESPLGTCVDVVENQGVHLWPGELDGPRATLTLDPFDGPFGGGGTPAGRCAGPLAADLEEALPTAELDTRRLAKGTVELDFSGRKPFAGGPFSGEVVSTLRYTRTSRRVRNAFPGSLDEPGDEDAPGGRRRSPERVAFELVYDIAAVRGGLTAGFAGGADPFCLPLDACGLRGAYALRGLRAHRAARVTISGDGRASALRGGRGLPAALRAARAGRLRVQRGGFSPGLSGELEVTAARDGAATCRERRRVKLPSLMLGRAGRGLELQLESGDAGPPTALTTRCPGPRATDFPGALAGGRIALGRIGARRIVVRMRTGTVASGGYTLAPRGELVLVLRRTGARLYRFGGDR